MITQIDARNSVALDGSGAGRVSLGPPSGSRWALDLANVSVVTAAGGAPAASSTCTLYRGSTNGPLQQVDVAQFTGNGAASGKVAGVPYFQGQVLWAVWSGGDPGAIATLQVYGRQALRSDPPFDAAPSGEGFPSIPSQVIIGNPNGPHIFIGAPVPAELETYYAARFGVISFTNACILFYTSATTYEYTIEARSTTFTEDFIATGWVDTAGPTIREQTFSLRSTSGTNNTHWRLYASGTAGNTPAIEFGSDLGDAGTFTISNLSTDFGHGLSATTPAGTITFNGAELERGTIDAVIVTTIGALTVASAAETDIPNLALTIPANSAATTRTLRIIAVVDLAMSTGTDTWQIQCRLDTALTGTVIGRAAGSGGTAPVAILDFPWIPTDNNAHTLHFSCDVIIGAGTAQAFGSPGGVVIRTWAKVNDDSANWRTS